MATVLLFIIYVSYMVLAAPVSQVLSAGLALPFMNAQTNSAMSYTVLAFGVGFVLLFFGIIAWGVASIFRRGDDTVRF